jgi:hypothetical protein
MKNAGLSIGSFLLFSITYRLAFKNIKSFRDYTTRWKKMTSIAWLSATMICLTPVLIIPMKVPYKTYILENFNRPLNQIPQPPYNDNPPV